jgi:hypothetical protein
VLGLQGNDLTFSRTVWRLYGGAKGLVVWYYLQRRSGLVERGDGTRLIPHPETFSATAQPPYSSAKG